MKLRSKFLLSLIVVVAALTSTTLLVVRRSFQRQVHMALGNDLRGATETFRILEQGRRELLSHSAEVVADAPSLRAMITSRDPKTIQDASADFVPAVHSDVFIISDASGRLMALHMRRLQPTLTEGSEWVRQLHLHEHKQQWALIAGHLYQIFSRPLYFGAPAPTHLLGWLTLGYEVNDSVLQQIAKGSGTDVMFLFGDMVTASTLSPTAQPTHVRGLEQITTHADALQPTREVFLDEKRYLAAAVPLGSHGVPVTLIVLKSFEDADQSLRTMNRILLLVGFGATAIGCLLIVGISSKLGGPLDELLAGVRALSHQDFAYPLNVRSKDEFGELTAAFEKMRTSLVAAQRELLQSQQLATIGRTASSLSHDLRHRLTAILANAEFLVDENGSERREQLYQGIRFAVRQMTDLLDSLLEFVRSPHTLNCRYLDLRDLLQQSVLEIRLYPQFSRVKVTMVPCEPVKAWFDTKRLHRVFFNLLLNACEVVPQETGAVEICIRQQDTRAEVRVRDNGPGIPENIRPSLFQPFVSSGKNKGTGLGLAIAQKCCQDHGGDVELEESSPGCTTFKVTLPLAGFRDERLEPTTTAEALA